VPKARAESAECAILTEGQAPYRSKTQRSEICVFTGYHTFYKDMPPQFLRTEIDYIEKTASCSLEWYTADAGAAVTCSDRTFAPSDAPPPKTTVACSISVRFTYYSLGLG